jgi:plastocyanin
MKQIHYLGVVVLVGILGCQSTPTVTRTGEVKDIIIGEKTSSGEVVVSPGDEVRWINKRTAPVRIVFLDPVSDKQLSCKNNFGGFMTSTGTAKLGTNETASACFRDPGYFRYTLRMESSLPTGEINLPGVIKVGGRDRQSIDQTNDQISEKASDRTGGSDRVGASSGSTSTTTTTTTTVTPQ